VLPLPLLLLLLLLLVELTYLMMGLKDKFRMGHRF
jgi:hypothetical protein